MNRLKICALVVPILALAGACGGGSNEEACNLAITATGAGSCAEVGGTGGGAGDVGGGVITPVGVNDTVTTEEGGPVSFNVTGSDSAGTGAATIVAIGPQIVFGAGGAVGTVDGGVAPSNGEAVVSDAAGGTITYTPNAGFNGTDTFTYTLEDENGNRAQAFVTVIVADLNPIATTLQGFEQVATFDTATALLAGLPAESAFLPRGTTDARITVGPLAAPIIDFDNLLGFGEREIVRSFTAAYTGGFEGTDGIPCLLGNPRKSLQSVLG